MARTMSFLTSFLIAILVYRGSTNADCRYDKFLLWSYNHKLSTGPKYWGELYSNCSGRQQSPINIITANAERDGRLENLDMRNYDIPLSWYSVENDGYAVKITPEKKENVIRTIVIHGERYSLSYIQFHWGDRYYRGSEHTINNIQYAFEIQLVHKNKEGNIAVVAALYESSLYNNSAFDTIIKDFKIISYKGSIHAKIIPIDLRKLVPYDCSFYRYNGSLTVPSCNEGIIWSICKNPSTIGYKQLDEFRNLHNCYYFEGEDLTECKLVNNFRSTQPLNGRVVKSSM